MMQKEVTITIKINGTSPIDLKQKTEVFQNFSRQSPDDQERLLEIMGSPKALEALRKNWTMLKLMFK
jgi:hypothetical protein